MENSGYGRRKRDVVSQQYTSAQIEEILAVIGADKVGATYHDFLCYCPYHFNRDTPSFSVSRSSGKFICFNGACGRTGTLMELIRHMTKSNEYEALRLISKTSKKSTTTFREQLAASIRPVKEIKEFSIDLLDRMYDDFWNPKYSQGREYMKTRGFEKSTMLMYRIGYSPKNNMVITPMHDIDGVPVGLIGRVAGGEKRFKNSNGLPTSQTLWNIHRAKATGDAVIICESNFDAMRISQAGYPNVVACLGGNFSPLHVAQLDKYFNRIIIMTDFDDKSSHTYTGCRKCNRKGLSNCRGHNPGRALGETIATEMIRKQIQWASYDNGIVYPDGMKDAGMMTDDDIRRCIKNSVSNYEYHSWHIPD